MCNNILNKCDKLYYHIKFLIKTKNFSTRKRVFFRGNRSQGKIVIPNPLFMCLEPLKTKSSNTSIIFIYGIWLLSIRILLWYTNLL